MTDIGIKDIENRVTSRLVYPPEWLTVDKLQVWVAGYLQCQRDVLDVIEELKEV